MTPLDPLTLALDGTTLIEASAGTGKTYTITTLYIRLLLERALQPSEILVVTYTNAATAELRGRIRRRLRDALAVLDRTEATSDETLRTLLDQRRARGTTDADRRALSAALCTFDEAAIFTIHGFCQRMLQEHAFQSGVPFDAQLVTDQAPLRDEVVRDFWARAIHTAPQQFVRYLQQANVTPATLTRLAQMAVAHPGMPVLPQEVETIAAPLAAWQAAHARVAELWHEARDTIVRLLADSGALKANMYPANGIRTIWAPQIDVALAAGMVTRFEKFDKLTAGALVRATKRNHAPPTHPFFDACAALSDADATLRTAFAHRLLRLQLDLVHYARHEVPQRNQRTNTQSFDDLLQRLDAALAGPGGATLAARIRSRFRAALIDEFQDTDPIQYDVFRRVYHGTDGMLLLIGDPKQAIYAFRGADVFTYMDARRDAGGSAYTLAINRRSGPRLVEAVNTLFRRARVPFVFDGIGFFPAQAAPETSEALGGAAAGQAPLQFLLARPHDGNRRSTRPPAQARSRVQLPLRSCVWRAATRPSRHRRKRAVFSSATSLCSAGPTLRPAPCKRPCGACTCRACYMVTPACSTRPKQRSSNACCGR